MDIEPKPMRIMLTGLGIGSANQEAKEAGIQKIVNKPVSGRHLKEVLLEFHKLLKPLNTVSYTPPPLTTKRIMSV